MSQLEQLGFILSHLVFLTRQRAQGRYTPGRGPCGPRADDGDDDPVDGFAHGFEFPEAETGVGVDEEEEGDGWSSSSLLSDGEAGGDKEAIVSGGADPGVVPGLVKEEVEGRYSGDDPEGVADESLVRAVLGRELPWRSLNN